MRVFRASTLTMLVLLLMSASSVFAEKTMVRYDSEKVYPGVFDPQQVYIAGDRHLTVVPGLRGRTAIYALQCVEAKTALLKDGYWEGEMDKEGRCVAPDSARIYLLGNLLNLGQQQDPSQGGNHE